MPGILPDTEAELRETWARIRAKEIAEATQADLEATTRAEISELLLRLLRDDLPVVIANQGYSEATLCEYRREWSRFKRYADESGLPSLPACPELVAVFLLERGLEGTSALTRMIGAIGARHRLAGHDDPTKDPLVTAMVRRIKRGIAEQKAGNGHDHELEPQEARH